MVTVNGRVRAVVRLIANGVDGAWVVASSWSSARVFPRTHAAGVAFELETTDGDVYDVDPFQALVSVPVRRRVVREGVATEDAWLAHGDEVEVQGEVEPALGDAPAILRARRVSTSAPTGVHRVPPGALTRGEAEPLAPPHAPEPSVAAEPTQPPEPPQPPEPARRPKKKRPDSSGTPTPIQ